MALYVPQWDPWAGVREGIMALAMGYGQGMEKRRMSDQIAQLMQNLPGTQTVESPAPYGEFVGPRAPMDVQEPFDLKKVMGGITDPNLATSILPIMMNYDSDQKRAQAAATLAKQKQDAEEYKYANEPVKVTAWKEKGDSYLPVTMTVPRFKVPDVEARLQEKGYFVGETPKAKPQGPHKVISYKDPITGRFVQKDTVTGQIMDYPGQGEGEKAPTQKEAANKISDIDKAIFSLETKGTLGGAILALLAARNPGLVDQLKGDPKEAIKTLEAERDYYLPYAPKQIQDRYKPKPRPSAEPSVKEMVWDSRLKKLVPAQ